TGRGDEAEGAETATLVTGAKRLRGVIEHEHALGLRDRTDGVVVGALPEQVDRDYRRRLQAELFRGGDAALQRGRIHVESCFIDIDKHRRGTGQSHGFAGREEG